MDAQIGRNMDAWFRDFAYQSYMKVDNLWSQLWKKRERGNQEHRDNKTIACSKF